LCQFISTIILDTACGEETENLGDGVRKELQSKEWKNIINHGLVSWKQNWHIAAVAEEELELVAFDSEKLAHQELEV